MKNSPKRKDTSQNEFSDREIGVVKNVVSDFLRKYPWFKGYEFKDLCQECCMHWLKRRHKYDPNSGASRTTFMANISRKKLLDILDEQMRHKRRANQIAQALDAPKDSSDPDITHQEELTKDKIGPAGYSENNPLMPRLALEKSLDTLQPLQKRICRLFAEGYNKTEIAVTLQKSRTTIHQEINRIREIFNRDRLHDFF